MSNFYEIAISAIVLAVVVAVGFAGWAAVFFTVSKFGPDEYDPPVWKSALFWGVYMGSMFAWPVFCLLTCRYLINKYLVTP